LADRFGIKTSTLYLRVRIAKMPLAEALKPVRRV
jgi:predicted DNA binding protein